MNAGIYKLIGEVISKVGGHTIGKMTKIKYPPEIAKRIRSYISFSNVWHNANDDLLALLAVSELIWEKLLQPVNRKDENKLLFESGVNAASIPATQTALKRMAETKKQFEKTRKKCEAISPLASAISKKSWLGGPANASQIKFDKMGCDMVQKQCTKNIKAIDRFIIKLNNTLSLIRDTLRVQNKIRNR